MTTLCWYLFNILSSNFHLLHTVRCLLFTTFKRAIKTRVRAVYDNTNYLVIYQVPVRTCISVSVLDRLEE